MDNIYAENLSNMLIAFAVLAVNNLHGAVCVPSGAVRNYPALLVLMRRALIQGFSQEFYCESRPYGPYDKIQYFSSTVLDLIIMLAIFLFFASIVMNRFW